MYASEFPQFQNCHSNAVHPPIIISNKKNFTGKLREFTLSKIPETNFALTKYPELKTQEWWIWID